MDVFLGEGQFAGADTFEVGDATLRYSKAVIATGAGAVEPDEQGLSEAGFCTNETIFTLTELPRRFGGPRTRIRG